MGVVKTFIHLPRGLRHNVYMTGNHTPDRANSLFTVKTLRVHTAEDSGYIYQLIFVAYPSNCACIWCHILPMMVEASTGRQKNSGQNSTPIYVYMKVSVDMTVVKMIVMQNLHAPSNSQTVQTLLLNFIIVSQPLRPPPQIGKWNWKQSVVN